MQKRFCFRLRIDDVVDSGHAVSHYVSRKIHAENLSKRRLFEIRLNGCKASVYLEHDNSLLLANHLPSDEKKRRMRFNSQRWTYLKFNQATYIVQRCPFVGVLFPSRLSSSKKKSNGFVKNYVSLKWQCYFSNRTDY